MTQLDPTPTLFGIGRIDPHEAPDGSTEYSRALLWITNRARRLSLGARIRVPLIGDPIAAYNVRADWQPISDWVNDIQGPDVYDDFDYDDPRSNWESNP